MVSILEFKLDKQKSMILILVLLIFVLVSGMFYYENKLSAENDEAAMMAEEITNQQVEINDLNNQIEQTSEELEAMEVIKEKVKFIEEYIDLEGEEVNLLKKAKNISDETPLDFKSSVVLVSYADRFDLKPSLLLSMIELESNFNQWEVGTSQDRGLMQIIPSTEKWLAEDFGDKIGVKYDPSKIFEPDYNIGLAATYLNIIQKAHGNDYNKILSEYNRGPYGLARYYEKNKTYETAYSRVILSKEKKYLAYNY